MKYSVKFKNGNKFKGSCINIKREKNSFIIFYELIGELRQHSFLKDEISEFWINRKRVYYDQEN